MREIFKGCFRSFGGLLEKFSMSGVSVITNKEKPKHSNNKFVPQPLCTPHI